MMIKTNISRRPSDMELLIVNAVGDCTAATGSVETCSSADMLIATPLSPSSKYTKSKLFISTGIACPFRGIVLCYWDNILGPRIGHVWQIPSHEELKSDLMSHITSQVLSCEICRDLSKCDIDYKFYNLPHEGVIIPAFVFAAKAKQGITVHSLYLVLQNTALKFYLEIHDTLMCCFQQLTGKLRVLLDKGPFNESIDTFTSYMADCMKFLSLIQSSSFANNVKLSNTAFCPEHVLEHEFLARCIASHLMTFGRSLVIGETAERINLVLYTLSMFNSQSEKRCSLPFCVRDPQQYHHDFFLQGLIIGSNSSVLPMTQILTSHYPTSVIYLSSRDVKQTPSFNEHIVIRHQVLKHELINLKDGNCEESVGPDQNLQPVTAYPNTLVQNFVKEMFELPEMCCIREVFLSQFMRMLTKRAQCLIECTRAECDDCMVPIKQQTLKRIRNDLQLNAEGDFRIVLAIAEKLKPGMFCYLKSHTN